MMYITCELAVSFFSFLVVDKIMMFLVIGGVLDFIK